MDILMGAGGRGQASPAQAQPQASNGGAGLYVRFRLKKAETKWGQNLALVGNAKALSEWKADRAPLRLKTSKQLYPAWESKDEIRFASK